MLSRRSQVRYLFKPNRYHREGLELRKCLRYNELRRLKKRVLLRRVFLSGRSTFFVESFRTLRLTPAAESPVDGRLGFLHANRGFFRMSPVSMCISSSILAPGVPSANVTFATAPRTRHSSNSRTLRLTDTGVNTLAGDRRNRRIVAEIP